LNSRGIFGINFYLMYMFVWHWCETWSLTLKEKHRLRAFENMLLGISEPKGERGSNMMDKIMQWGAS
jgi:hypothetical protein